MADRIEFLNRALLRIGADPLQSEDDPSARVHLAVYTSVIERLFAQPWTWCKQTQRLTRLTAEPAQRWRFAFQHPPQMIGPPRAFYADPLCRSVTHGVEVEAAGILSDHEALWITFLREMPWHRWPGDFRELATVAVMAELAMSVREDRALHDRFYQKAFGTPSEQGAGGLFSDVLSNDNQSEPDDEIGMGESPLIDVRF